MKARKQDLQRLKTVTEAAWLAASQTLRAKAGQEQAAAARLKRLQRDRDTCMKLVADEDTPPEMAQVVSAARWMRWSEAERARQNVALARLRAELAREQDAARDAFARDQALAKLLAAARRK